MRRRLFLSLVFILYHLASVAEIHAQTKRNPFAVGAEQGGGQSGGLAGWFLQQQEQFYLPLKAKFVEASHTTAALWTILALSFAYGLFHAAGPGHGKAVVSSYMLASRKALRLGWILSFAAAALQGTIAIMIIAIGSLIFGATSATLNNTSVNIEILSDGVLVLFAIWLFTTKARAAINLWREPKISFAKNYYCSSDSLSIAWPARHRHGPDCGHFHAPDPKTLEDNFSWSSALATIGIAGARPCSGALLILIFTLKEGLFLLGIAATFAMSFGTALATATLAGVAVFSKRAGLWLTRGNDQRQAMMVLGLEMFVALIIFLMGLFLLTMTLPLSSWYHV